MADVKGWDRHAIAAEIKRRGSSLRRISREAGLSDSTCRGALYRPLPSGEKAISDFLDIPVHVLWPDRHVAPSSRRPEPIRKDERAASPNRTAA